MDPATLIKDARERHGLSQARLAHRARTTQAAISRIERGEEAVTWDRLRTLMSVVGEEPVVTTRPLDYFGDPQQLQRAREASREAGLRGGLASNRNVSRMRLDVAHSQRAQGRTVTIRDTEVFEGSRILETLAEFGVDHVVIGGVAVQAHGSPRLTKDLDIIPRPDLVNFSRLAEALIELEPALKRTNRPIRRFDPQRFARTPLLPLSTRFGELDVLSAEHAFGGTYDDLRSRAIEVKHGSIAVLVAGVDDLVRMKRIAGRPIDLHDIATLTTPSEGVEREAEEIERRVREQLGLDEDD